MSDYTKAVDFAAKDAMNTGDPSKTITGTAHDNEYNAIATAIATKADAASPTLTGTGTAVNLTMSGTMSTDTIAETTAAEGVTVDGLLIKDSSIPEAAVTEHEAALTITESQISDLGSYLVAADIASLATEADLTLAEADIATNTSDITDLQADTLPRNSDTDTLAGTSKTLAAGDEGQDIVCTSASAVTITVPGTLVVGFQCTISQVGAGTVTITSADNLNGGSSDVDLPSQWSSVWLFQYSEGNWLVSGA